MSRANVITRRPVPTIEAAHAYLVEQGYINCGTFWFRDLRDSARIAHQADGTLSVIEEVA